MAVIKSTIEGSIGIELALVKIYQSCIVAL